MVLAFGKIRNFCPMEEDLRNRAEARGIDGHRITTALFEVAVKQGPEASSALRDLIHFDGSLFHNETTGSSKEGRMQARVTLLNALADELEEHPLRSMAGAVRDVDLGHDKVFLAQSYQYANITHLTEALKERAQELGLDAETLVTKIFDRAVEEGPQSVQELHDLLHFSDSLFNDETRGSTAVDRLDARLVLLTDLEDSLGRGAVVTSIQGKAADIGRVTKKVEIAQSYGMVRKFNPKHEPLVKMAKLRNMDVKRVTEDLYQRAVDGDQNDRAALHDFLNYSGHFWNNEKEGTTDTGRMFALAGAMESLAQFFEDLQYLIHLIFYFFSQQN